MAVYVITHKIFDWIPEENYKTLLVGACKGHVFGDVYDDEGDNISAKNPNYCELTGVYWVWKNTKDRYVGIVHYRRYFSKYFFRGKKLKDKDIKNVLDQYDLILPFKYRLKKPVLEQYCDESGYLKDIEFVRNIISERYPEYLTDFDKVMKEKKIYLCNMMICKKDLFDEYCEWLFSILFLLEESVDLTMYNDYQKRIYGFMSERLLNVWIRTRNLKIFEVGVINTESNWSLSRKILTGLKRRILFKFKVLNKINMRL